MQKIQTLLTTTLAIFKATIWLLSCNSVAGEAAGHQIVIHLADKQETECYLAYHYGNRQYLQDTAFVDQHGQAVFEGPDRLSPGLYLIVLDDDKNFELIIDHDQHFTIYADPEDFVSSVDFDGSPDNEALYDYLSFLSEKNRERQALEQEVSDTSTPPERKMEAQEILQGIEKSVMEKQDEIIAGNPEGLLARILSAQRDPELPDPPLLPDGQQDTDAMYQLYKEKFFNNIDFSDERLLYTPVYHSRLRIFFNNVLIQHPDSIIREAERILDKAKASSEVFRYTLSFITTNAESSQMMGMDKVFVHMVENYYLTDAVDWLPKDRVEQLKSRIGKMKTLLMGNVAPNLRVQDPGGKTVTLYDIEAEYLVLYFWDSECVFCEHAAPHLINAHENLREEGVKVFAINSEADRERWLQALATYPGEWIHGHAMTNMANPMDVYNIFAIPTIYILDREKNILAKDIGVENVEPFIRQDMRNR